MMLEKYLIHGTPVYGMMTLIDGDMLDTPVMGYLIKKDAAIYFLHQDDNYQGFIRSGLFEERCMSSLYKDYKSWEIDVHFLNDQFRDDFQPRFDELFYKEQCAGGKMVSVDFDWLTSYSNKQGYIVEEDKMFYVISDYVNGSKPRSLVTEPFGMYSYYLNSHENSFVFRPKMVLPRDVTVVTASHEDCCVVDAGVNVHKEIAEMLDKGILPIDVSHRGTVRGSMREHIDFEGEDITEVVPQKLILSVKENTQPDVKIGNPADFQKPIY